MKTKIISAVLFLIVLPHSPKVKFRQEVKDFLNVPGPILFNNTSYTLKWSSNPVKNFYLQEYYPPGDSIVNFKKMILFEVIISDNITLDKAVADKITELKNRKKTDVVVNFELNMNANKDDYILDFVESESAGQKLHVVEWNAYRFRITKDKNSHRALTIFGVSYRAYDFQIRDFFNSLKEMRSDITKKLSEYKFPEWVVD